MGKARGKKGKAATRSHDDAAPRTQDEEQQDLMKEFGAFIEESIIILFLKEQGFEKAREALSIISVDVRNEEASGFDGSGLPDGGADPAVDASDVGSSRHTAAGGGSASLHSSTATSQDTPLSGDALDAWRGVANDLPADGSSTVAILRDAFPTLTEADIKHALKQTGDDVDKASDILLNLEHLEQTGQRAKGIDAFFQLDDVPARLGKKKKKKKNKDKSPLSPKAGREIPLALDYKLTPLRLDDDDDAEDGHPARAQTMSAPPLLNGPGGGGGSGGGSLLLSERQEIARAAREKSGQSFALASAAARRGRSDPLFRQAAVVFAERGHEQARDARRADSSAADALVDGQSSAGMVDVHFVPVHDGVRIAVDRTRRWWARLGEDRVRKARDMPLQVVTGIGLHSARGYSRMYGEVGAALERDGWKVQPGQGHYYITGKK